MSGRRQKQSGFTLIELLVTVAILGILATAAIMQYQGYQLNAKINAAKSNHTIVTNMIQSSLSNCSAGSLTIALGANSVNCDDTLDNFVLAMETYLNSLNMKNPYDGITSAISVGAAGATDGVTYLTVAGNAVTITTIATSVDIYTSNVMKE